MQRFTTIATEGLPGILPQAECSLMNFIGSIHNQYENLLSSLSGLDTACKGLCHRPLFIWRIEKKPAIPDYIFVSDVYPPKTNEKGFPCSILLIVTTITILFSCKKEFSCERCKENNRSPIAVAEPDQVIALSIDSVSLDGTASSHPDGTIIEWLWKKIKGPASLWLINQMFQYYKPWILIK